MRIHRLLAITWSLLALGCVILGTRAAVIAVESNLAVPFVKTIIIDAGHGGFDGGAVGDGGTVEKEINLSISRKLQQLGELYGFEVIMVREQDKAVYDEGTQGARNQKVSDIHNRLALAKANPQAIFLSIHQNKFPQSRPWGAQIFYGQQNPQSRALAQRIQDDLREQLQPENHRQIKPAEKNLYILHNAKNPAVLIECGFLSNPEECNRLKDERYQEEIAFVILTALIEHVQMSTATP